MSERELVQGESRDYWDVQGFEGVAVTHGLKRDLIHWQLYPGGAWKHVKVPHGLLEGIKKKPKPAPAPEDPRQMRLIP